MRSIMLFWIIFLSVSLYAQDLTQTDKNSENAESEKNFESREIIVKGKKDQPDNTAIITEKDVKNSTKTDLINVINQNVPSFYTPNNRVMGFGVSSSGAAQMSVRGIGQSGWGPTTGLPILINGLDTTTSIMGHPIADIFTMKNIDRVEVLIGPQPVLYGSGALGGVVNVVTKRQKTDGYQTDLSGSYGSYNSTDDFVSHIGKIGLFDYGVSYNFQRTDGHREQKSPNGTEMTSEYYNHNGTARFGFELGKNWYAGMNSYVMKQKIHDPGPEGASSATINGLEVFDILRNGISLNILNNYNKFDGMIHVFYNSGNHEAEKTATNTKSYKHDDQLYGTRVTESAKLIDGNKITAGVDTRKWGGSSKNMVTGNYYVKDKYLTDISGFGLIEQRLFNALTLSGGARYTDNSKFGGFTAWQGGLIVNPYNCFKIHSTAARGFKLPDLRQLYIKMYGAEVPNENLKTETYTSYDAGIELLPVKELSFDITGYRIYSDNKIMKSGNNWINYSEFNYNGAEATVNYTYKIIKTRAGYSYIDNIYDGQKLAYVPRHKILGGISCELYGFYTGIDGEYIKFIWADTAGTHKLSNYLVLNAKLAYTFLEHYRAFINFNNITNKDYVTYSYKETSPTTKYLDYPMPGFNVLGGLSVSI
ncbi:MAG: TonB-dependent receptor [Spirochaetota bacterium]